MSSTAAAAAAQNEHEKDINKENISSTQSSQLLVTSTQTPILTERIHTQETVPPEDEMIAKINIAIRRLLTRPNHQSPYRYNFRWTIDEEPNLNYRVLLSIREPSRRISH